MIGLNLIKAELQSMKMIQIFQLKAEIARFTKCKTQLRIDK